MDSQGTAEVGSEAIPGADLKPCTPHASTTHASSSSRAPPPPRRSSSIVPFDAEESPDDLLQIRDLFVDGMKVNDAPEDYIAKSLGSDLNDAGSLRETYLSGRGTFLMLVENEEGEAAVVSSESSNGSDANGNGTSDSGRKSIKGMVGLRDVSPTTGCGVDSNGTTEQKNLCELRRMSIHSSCRRSGYGAMLVEACISHAKRNGFDGIKLYTGAWMEAAIRFYVKMGFVDRCRLDYVNGDGSTVTIAHLEMTF